MSNGDENPLIASKGVEWSAYVVFVCMVGCAAILICSVVWSFWSMF